MTVFRKLHWMLFTFKFEMLICQSVMRFLDMRRKLNPIFFSECILQSSPRASNCTGRALWWWKKLMCVLAGELLCPSARPSAGGWATCEHLPAQILSLQGRMYAWVDLSYCIWIGALFRKYNFKIVFAVICNIVCDVVFCAWYDHERAAVADNA